MSRSPARKNSRAAVRASMPSVPNGLVCAAFAVTPLVGLIAGLFVLLVSGVAVEGAALRLLLWCAVCICSGIASAILYYRDSTRRKWFSVLLYVLCVVSVVRIAVPTVLLFSDLIHTQN